MMLVSQAHADAARARRAEVAALSSLKSFLEENKVKTLLRTPSVTPPYIRLDLGRGKFAFVRFARKGFFQVEARGTSKQAHKNAVLKIAQIH